MQRMAGKDPRQMIFSVSKYGVIVTLRSLPASEMEKLACAEDMHASTFDSDIVTGTPLHEHL